MRGITQQRKATRPDTADKFTDENAERDKDSKLEFLLKMFLMAMPVPIIVMVVTVIMHSVSL